MPTFQNEIKDKAAQRAIEKLLGAGIDDNFAGLIRSILEPSVSTASLLDDVINSLSLTLVGNSDIPGTLERYIKQVTTDTLYQFAAEYNTALANEANLQFFRYVGGTVRDTRPFCFARVGDFFHRLEIRDLGNGESENGGKLSDDELKGRAKGTNGSTIFIYRGGYNCGHEWIGVSPRRVPKPVIERAIEKGYYTPTEKQREILGI